MSLFKQTLLSLLLIAAAAWGAAHFVPGAADRMRSLGMGPLLDRIGVVAEG